MPAFPYVIVRYESGSIQLGAVIMCYAFSLEHAFAMFHALAALQESFDPTAIYAIREWTECQMRPAVYPCGCGGFVGGR